MVYPKSNRTLENWARIARSPVASRNAKRLTSVMHAAALSALLRAGTAAAGSWEDEVAAAKRGDYAAALELWRPLADQGKAPAKHVLGLIYAMGTGVPEDEAKALRWYRLAAGQGNADAAYALGVMYSDGHRLPEDSAQASEWFHLARMAADRGDSNPQDRLGEIYAQGQGGPQDYSQALTWYLIYAAWSLGPEIGDNAFDNPFPFSVLITSAQLAEVQNLAQQWKSKQSLAHGFALARLRLGARASKGHSAYERTRTQPFRN
jgi:uncharacterized protein